MAQPSLDDLRNIECAVRTGSFSAAARELGVSQQAVSARLRNLERLIGIELVHRSHTGVAPTAAGAEFLAQAGEVLAASQELDRVVAGIQGVAARTITVGASQTIASHLLPGWLQGLRRAEAARQQPVTHVHLRTDNSEAVIAMVRAGTIDLGFIETPEPPRGLGSTIVGQDTMVLAVDPDHPWAHRRRVRLEEIASTPLVARERGSGTRSAFEFAAAARLGRSPAEPIVTLATEAAVRSAVAHGVAPAVLSELTIHDDVRLGRVRALNVAPAPITRPFTAIWRGSHRDLTGARQELVALAGRTSGRKPRATDAHTA